MDYSRKTKDMIVVALSVAVLITGGFIIIHLSMFFPIPGVKYILMAPFLSTVIYILMIKAKTRYVLLKFGMTFGFIMMIINMYMGLAIILTAIMTQVSLTPITNSKKYLYAPILFPAYTGFFALYVSKTLIGGVFSTIPIGWILTTSGLCLIFGVIGTIQAKKLMKHIINFK